MVSLKGDYVRKQWRYNVSEEFHRVPENPTEPAGEEAKWAVNHPLVFTRGEAGGASRYLKFNDTYDAWASWSLNSDQTKLAVILRQPRGRRRYGDTALHLWDLTSGTCKGLKGHHGEITGVRFSPTDPNLLVTASTPPGPHDNSQAEILIWDVSADIPLVDPMPEEELIRSAGAAVDGMTPLELSPEEQLALRTKIRDCLAEVIGERVISGIPKLHGRVCSSFNSEPFSHDGQCFIYLPGERPESNGRDERWILQIYDVHTRSDTVTLNGHTDDIMWVGWSPTDRWIMSISWDRTVRIWDAKTGEEKWQWKTKGQNWSGVFGPPGKDGEAEWVIGTSGDGLVHCWSLETGDQLWSYADPGHVHRWIRAVAFSPSGRYVLVGGEEGAGVKFLDMKRERGKEKEATVEAITERRLGSGDLRAQLSPEEEEATDPTRKKELDLVSQSMVISNISVRAMRFIDEHRVVWFASTDNSIHMYDIRTNLMYRWAPEYPPIPREGEEWEMPTECLGFEVREQDGEQVLWTVHSDGLRTWGIPSADDSEYEMV